MMNATAKMANARWAATVAARREALGWSRGTLATMAGVAERTVQNLEKGWRSPYNSTKRAIDHALANGERRQRARRGV